MTANSKCNKAAGNAMIYVLIVVALFAALTFVLARRHGEGEANSMSPTAVNVGATQILQLSNQIKDAVDQMIYAGSRIDELDFCRPQDACFSTGLTRHKVFHPDGGGVVLPALPADAVHQADANPAPGWYMGRFNNVAWTNTNDLDVILVAHQINQKICAKINSMLTGSSTIPTLTVALSRALIDAGLHSAGSNVDLDTTSCPACDGKPSLCVSDAAATTFSFYNVIEQR